MNEAKKYPCGYNNECDESICPFKEIYDLREDGYCFNEMMMFSDSWIAQNKDEIKEIKRQTEERIKTLEDEINRYERVKEWMTKKGCK